MEEFLLKTFDFGIRVVELANYLENENKKFALIDRLLECGTGVGICMRISCALPQFSLDNYKQAFILAAEAEYLFEMMVKTNVITENQSKPIRSDCSCIKNRIEKMISTLYENILL